MNVRRRILLFLSMLIATSQSACNKESAAVDVVRTAPVDRPSKEEAAGTGLTGAKAGIDAIVGAMEAMTSEIEAVDANHSSLKAIGDRVEATAKSLTGRAEALKHGLTPAERAHLDAYGKQKMTPVMVRLMGAMMRLQEGSQPAAIRGTLAPSATPQAPTASSARM